MVGSVDLATVLIALGRIEGKLDMLLGARGEGQVTAPPPEKKKVVVNPGAEAFFRQFTPRQHVTLQMLLRGCENKEIADRLGVTDNTVKVHIRNIARRLGVTNRVQIALRATRMFEQIDDNSYRMLSGGLPKTWDQEWSAPDPFEAIYRKDNNQELEVEDD